MLDEGRKAARVGSKAEPNLFVVGVQRAGSTSLWRYLRKHPDIYMADAKEPGFLAFDAGVPLFEHVGDAGFHDQVELDEQRYLDLFVDGSELDYRGESTSFYLYFEASRLEIKRRFPEARIIVVLRDPIERIWSSYNYLRRLGAEPLPTITEALDAEPQRIADHWEPLFHYEAESRYFEQLEHLYDVFDSSQIFVTVLERLETDGHNELARLFAWLGVDPHAEVGVEIAHNSAGTSRFPAINSMLSPGWLPSPIADRIPQNIKDFAVTQRERMRRSDYEAIPEELIERLAPRFEAEYQRLPELIGFDPTTQWATAERAQS